VCNQRLDDLDEFLATVPASHLGRVEDVVPVIVDRLWVAGPALPCVTDPVFVRWAVCRSTLGHDHPFNQARPDPTPAALLDLLFAHPGADLPTPGCHGCGILLPHIPASGQIGVPYTYVRPRCLTDTCPACGVDIPPPRTC
jgi:hypothetical protein